MLHQQPPPAQALQQPLPARRSRGPPAQGWVMPASMQQQPSWASAGHSFNDDDELN
jgi:hypothetical protein